jgi:hypothetical protein
MKGHGAIELADFVDRTELERAAAIAAIESLRAVSQCGPLVDPRSLNSLRPNELRVD